MYQKVTFDKVGFENNLKFNIYNDFCINDFNINYIFKEI